MFVHIDFFHFLFTAVFIPVSPYSGADRPNSIRIEVHVSGLGNFDEDTAVFQIKCSLQE